MICHILIASAKWTDLCLIQWVDKGLQVRIGLLWILIFTAIIVCILVVQYWRPKWSMGWHASEVKFKFSGIEATVAPNIDTIRIAYQAWIEMTTRKVGLLFNQENDVIIEVYDSWYRMFGIFRELIKSVPAQRLRKSKDTQQLVELMRDVMNQGMRPHLSRWQARFRKWYVKELAAENESGQNDSPQQIQRRFPEYEELISDLSEVNLQLVEFSERLKTLAGINI